MSRHIPQRNGDALPQPVWCRRDMCDEATPGREIDHHTGPWSQVVSAATGRRLNLAATRTDSRERDSGPVDTGPTMVELSIDEFVPIRDQQGNLRGTWRKEDGGVLEMSTDETRTLARQLLRLADTIDAAVTVPALLRAD